MIPLYTQTSIDFFLKFTALNFGLLHQPGNYFDVYDAIGSDTFHSCRSLQLLFCHNQPLTNGMLMVIEQRKVTTTYCKKDLSGNEPLNEHWISLQHRNRCLFI